MAPQDEQESREEVVSDALVEVLLNGRVTLTGAEHVYGFKDAPPPITLPLRKYLSEWTDQELHQGRESPLLSQRLHDMIVEEVKARGAHD
jgi:hypothetical protein